MRARESSLFLFETAITIALIQLIGPLPPLTFDANIPKIHDFGCRGESKGPYPTLNFAWALPFQPRIAITTTTIPYL